MLTSYALQVKLTGHAMLPVGADDRVVVVRDEEPTSLVAYALASRRASFCLTLWPYIIIYREVNAIYK